MEEYGIASKIHMKVASKLVTSMCHDCHGDIAPGVGGDAEMEDMPRDPMRRRNTTGSYWVPTGLSGIFCLVSQSNRFQFHIGDYRWAIFDSLYDHLFICS
jgi:hypothetical protein